LTCRASVSYLGSDSRSVLKPTERSHYELIYEMAIALKRTFQSRLPTRGRISTERTASPPSALGEVQPLDAAGQHGTEC
jgi:hypothetical protein